MKAIEVQRQINKVVLVAAIEFKELNSIVQFTKRETSDWDPYDENSTQKTDYEYYQRLTESDRVKQIELFINETLLEQRNDTSSISTLFPSSMIVSFESDNIENNGGIIDLALPSGKNCLIVDGQHRFAAMQNLLKKKSLKDDLDNAYIIDKVLNYKFNCTVLVNFDLWEQAQVFANVNFNQKKVNKSLYYDIFGSTPDSEKIDKRSGLYLAHSLAQFLNNSSKSPICNFVKMLGTGDGYFSQAFLVESILVHFKPRGVWADINEDYRKKGTKHKILPKIFGAYFSAVKSIFSDYWPNEESKYNSILCKTSGMGALIRMLGYMYKLLSVGAYPNQGLIDFEQIKTEELQQIFVDIFNPIKNKGKDLFSSDSIYAGAGSAGLQSKLYKQIGQELGLFKKDIF